MDWTIKPYAEANHPPIVNLKSADYINAKVGDTIELSAEGSKDPDGDNLTYKWYHYREPGSFTQSGGKAPKPIEIKNADKVNAQLTIPKPERLGTVHIILEVTDNGSPSLTRYKRTIIRVN